jgi:hypothetical protein
VIRDRENVWEVGNESDNSDDSDSSSTSSVLNSVQPSTPAIDDNEPQLPAESLERRIPKMQYWRLNLTALSQLYNVCLVDRES